MPKITIAQNILAANDTIAQDIHQALTDTRNPYDQYDEFAGRR